MLWLSSLVAMVPETGPFIFRCFNNYFSCFSPRSCMIRKATFQTSLSSKLYMNRWRFLSLVSIPVLLHFSFPIMYMSFSSLESARIVNYMIFNFIILKLVKTIKMALKILSLTRFKSESSLNPAHPCNSSSWSCEKFDASHLMSSSSDSINSGKIVSSLPVLLHVSWYMFCSYCGKNSRITSSRS